jgi:hypothetical protein
VLKNILLLGLTTMNRQYRQYLNSLLHSPRRVSLKNNTVSDVIDTEKDYARNRLMQLSQ